MNLLYNGEARETQTRYLSELLLECQVDENAVATALNGDFVPRSLRASTPLRDGDRVEVVAPMQGG